jgi:hypothetical protein
MGIDWFMWLPTLLSSCATSGNSSPVSSRVGVYLGLLVLNACQQLLEKVIKVSQELLLD